VFTTRQLICQEHNLKLLATVPGIAGVEVGEMKQLSLFVRHTDSNYIPRSLVSL